MQGRAMRALSLGSSAISMILRMEGPLTVRGNMARTQGHGNPAWNRDETILALELYFETEGRVSPADDRVVALSETLRSLPYHAEAARQATFRNPAGVGFKVQNLRQVATGKGLGNVSQMDRHIWQEFGNRPDEVRRLARLIRDGIGASEDIADESREEPEFYEGRLLTRLHLYRERNPRVRARLLLSRRADGLRCEICDQTYSHIPQEMVEALFEAHHVIPVAEAGERRIRVQDMALLCACCHRLIHRAISVKGRWVSVAEVRSILSR